MDKEIFIMYSNYLAEVERKMWYNEYNKTTEDQLVLGIKGELDNNTDNLNNIFYNPKQYHMEGQIDYTKTNIRYFESSGIPIATTFTNLPANSIRPGRRVGNTTRLLDHAITLLFEGNIVKVYDHYREDMANVHLFKLIVKRLRTEHDPSLPPDRLVIDRPRLMLYLKPLQDGANKETTTATQA